MTYNPDCECFDCIREKDTLKQVAEYVDYDERLRKMNEDHDREAERLTHKEPSTPSTPSNPSV